MKPIKQSFAVPYVYNLHFTQGLFDASNEMFKNIIQEYKASGKVKVLFVIDDGIQKHHPYLQKSINDYCQFYSNYILHTDTLFIPGGEQCKNDYKNVESILKSINDNAICRHSFVVVIGGGAVIDMTGYSAAIAHRGVKLIRIPTTVLSQNDSAVGVKNSINAFGKKNFLGTFAPPYAIINDSDFLRTLEQRDWIAGVSEALKVALIKDEAFFQFLEENALKIKARDMEVMQYLIHKCADMHMDHIAQGGDPFESGSSRPLDFGHWAAHKMEQMSNYELRHGEAVAKGIALDVAYAFLTNLIPEEALRRIIDTMVHIGFDLRIPLDSENETSQLLDGIEEFREHLGGELTITLIAGIGVKHDVHKIDHGLMKSAITKLNDMCKINVAL